MQTLAIVLPALTAFFAVVYVLAAFVGRKKKPEERHHFRCTKCGHRISYTAGQVGKSIHCPNCNRLQVYPEIKKDPWIPIEEL